MAPHDSFKRLNNLFELPQIRALPGGKPPRTKVTEVLEEAFETIASLCAPDLVIEVGAFEADFSRRMSVLHPGSRVVAFEANPRVYQRFAAEMSATRVEYRHVAVSDASGEAIIHIPEVIAGHTMPFANRMGSLNIVSAENQTVNAVVPTVTLDEAVGENFDNAVLWVDVEGAADRVIAGGTRTLEKTMCIMVEVETAHFWQGQMLAGPIIADLERRGFVAVARDCQKKFQFNLVCVKEPLLSNSVLEGALSGFEQRSREILQSLI